MTGNEAFNIIMSDFKNINSDGRLSLMNGKYLCEKDGSIYLFRKNATVRSGLLETLPDSVLTEIMFEIKELYKKETDY